MGKSVVIYQTRDVAAKAIERKAGIRSTGRNAVMRSDIYISIKIKGLQIDLHELLETNLPRMTIICTLTVHMDSPRLLALESNTTPFIQPSKT